MNTVQTAICGMDVTIERGLPLVGVLPAMLRDGPGALLGMAARHRGELFAMRLGPVRVPVVVEPVHLQEVLVERAKDFTHGGMWEETRPLLGHGLVTSDGDFWRRQRRLLQPLFTARHLRGLTDVIVAALAAQLEHIAARAETGPLDMVPEMTALAQRVLMDTIFGDSLGPEEAAAMGHHVKAAFLALSYRLPLYFLPAWMPRPRQRAFVEAVAALDDSLMRLAAKRRQQPTDAVDLLNRLVAVEDVDTGETMTERQIRDELVTLFVAGLDTTSLTLTWLCWLLATHPEVEAGVRAEIGQVVGRRLPTCDDLPKLEYTKRVIQETLRLYPPAWQLPRYADGGTTIAGHRIGPGTSLLVSPYVTHRNPELWQNPERFDPDRFLPAQCAKRPKMAYLPFGGGQRICLGSHLAMMESQLAVVMLLQRFRMRLVPGQRIVPASAATLTPRYGVKMYFEGASQVQLPVRASSQVSATNPRTDRAGVAGPLE